MDELLLGRQSALAGARALLPLLGDGRTVEEIRDLIAMPVAIERALRVFAQAHPDSFVVCLLGELL